jgi:D-alanine-D-alanine ligase
MRIGLTYTLKSRAVAPTQASLPDDWDEEFDSPETIDALAMVIRGMGHEPVFLGDGPEMVQALLDNRPDFVFNIAEGQGVGRSREARVPALLELMGIPYSGSDPLTLSVALDKGITRQLVRGGAVKVAEGFSLGANEDPDEVLSSHSDLRFPLVIKPAWEGSSKGIRSKCLVENATELKKVINELRTDYLQPLLVEEFIGGAELTVGLVGNDPTRVIGIMEVIPLKPSDRFLYSLEVKRDWANRVRYQSPAQIPTACAKALEKAALEAWGKLGCRDLCRMDFRLNREGDPVFIEANPLPGVNPVTSDLILLAKGMGWEYSTLIETVILSGLKRVGLS